MRSRGVSPATSKTPHLRVDLKDVSREQFSAAVTGIITSGSRYEIEIQNGVNLPVLFLHHERDGCKFTPYSFAKTNFEKTNSRNKSVTELATIKGGGEKGDPCRDGRHMYFGAYEEAARYVEQFMTRNHPAGEKM